jgi:transposase InsO family protein
MALGHSTRNFDHLIHHSDRGTQYCSNEYIKLLKKHEVAISMIRDGDPGENAIAERVNGMY